MTDFEATLQQELSDFAKSELVAQTPEDGEQHDVGREVELFALVEAGQELILGYADSL